MPMSAKAAKPAKPTVTVEVGQSLKIVSSTGRHRAEYDGTVVKVGRVWIDVNVAYQANWSSVTRFRLDTQTDGSQYGAPARFYTLDQWAHYQREVEAGNFLREQGISVDYGSPWRQRTVELAEIMRTHLAATADEVTTTQED